MSNRSLGFVVALLGISVWLALTNPTTQDYVAFLEQRLVLALEQWPQGKSDLAGALLTTPQGRQVIGAVVRPNTVRRSYGLFSLFETSFLGERVLVLGAGGVFWPVQGVEQVTKKIGALGLKQAN
ncbi:MAG: DUF4359 domain-containing protein [Nitrospirae bacterium]|nr:MAG: DUF4359 domain-containing protein [Nitrospirota bacterium]